MGAVAAVRILHRRKLLEVAARPPCPGRGRARRRARADRRRRRGRRRDRRGRRDRRPRPDPLGARRRHRRRAGRRPRRRAATTATSRSDRESSEPALVGRAPVSEQRRARLVPRHLLDGSGSERARGRAQPSWCCTPPTRRRSSCRSSPGAPGSRLPTSPPSCTTTAPLVRMMAMRRTLFVAPLDLAPVVHHAASVDVAATIRKRLLKELATGPTDPPLPDDPERCPAGSRTRSARSRRTSPAEGPLSGARIGDAVPARCGPRSSPAPPRSTTSAGPSPPGADADGGRGPAGPGPAARHVDLAPAHLGGRRRRGGRTGSPTWTARRRGPRLVEHYLRAFGPVTETDVAWWTGWPLGVTRKALGGARTPPTSRAVSSWPTTPARSPYRRRARRCCRRSTRRRWGGSSGSGSCRRTRPGSTTPTATSGPPSGGAARWSGLERPEGREGRDPAPGRPRPGGSRGGRGGR